MTKTLSRVSHKNYNLSANEGFVMFFTSKLHACFIDGFTSNQSIAYLLNESEHIYWTMDLENEVHSIWVIRTSGLQECKGNFIFRSQVERAARLEAELETRWGVRPRSGQGRVGSCFFGVAPAWRPTSATLVGGV